MQKKAKRSVGCVLLCSGLLAGCSQNTPIAQQDPVTQTETGKDDSGVKVSVDSTILGMGYTHNKTTLKKILEKTGGPGDTYLYYYDDEGKCVKYNSDNGKIDDPDQSDIKIELEPVEYKGKATITLENADDSKIDTSHATVRLIDGNGYQADGFILSDEASKLGTFQNGTLDYSLKAGDIDFNYWDYPKPKDTNSGREWSIMGGDGNGVYDFRLEADGITYDGEELDPIIIHAPVYIYGRSVLNLSYMNEYTPNTIDSSYSIDTSPADREQWIWHTANEASEKANQPYMNDTETDYFTIVWPEGTDSEKVKSISKEDIKATLSSAYGDTLELKPVNDYDEVQYDVLTNEEATETTIAVSYQQWACAPVYSKLDIQVDAGDLKAEHEWDVSSVSAYMVQTGGGGQEGNGTLVCYNYHGVDNMTFQNSVDPDYLTVELKDNPNYEDGTYYYGEQDGKAVLLKGEQGQFGHGSAPEGAWVGQVSESDHIVQGNVVFNETIGDIEKEVDGKTYSFTRTFKNLQKQVSQMIEGGATLIPGFNVMACPVQSQSWAWTDRYESGWIVSDPQPDSLPYVNVYGYGYENASTKKENYAEAIKELKENSSDTNGPGGFSGPGAGGPGVGGPGAGFPGAPGEAGSDEKISPSNQSSADQAAKPSESSASSSEPSE